MRIRCSWCAASRGVVETKVEGAIAPIEDKAKPAAGAPAERRWTIHGDGRATIRRQGAKAADVAFSVIPAGVPTIALAKDPVSNLSGSLTLAYRIEDRYGITSARAEFALPPDSSGKAPRSLAQPPRGRPRDRRHRHRNRRGERDGRSFRAPVGRRQGDDDAERDQRLGQDGQEPAGRSDPAAAALPQSARPGAGRGAPRSHPRSGPCPQTRRGGADRPRRRPGTVRHPRPASISA